MTLIEELKELGVNVDEGLDRVMGDNSLYEMMLGMFIDSVNNNPVRPEDFQAEGLDTLIERVHMLKGVTGNLAMTPIFARYTEVLAMLRANQLEEAKEGFQRILPIQKEIMDCIQRHQG